MPPLLRGQHNIPEGMSGLGDPGWWHMWSLGSLGSRGAGLSSELGSWEKWRQMNPPSRPVIGAGSPHFQVQVGPPQPNKAQCTQKEVRALGLGESGTVPQSPGGLPPPDSHPQSHPTPRKTEPSGAVSQELGFVWEAKTKGKKQG